ncbi:MAG TPA: ABC transporter permease, partial [Candidatus Limnocylindrales bacterium]
AAARGAVEDGSATIAIVLPPGLGATTPPTAATTFTVITEGLDPTGEAGQVGSLQKAMLSVAASLAGRPLPALRHVTVFGVPSSDPITTYAPAIVGFLVYFFVYILTGVSFLRERTGGTLERLLATPVTRGEIVAGYTLGFGVFAVIQVVVMLLWSLGTLTVPAVGPLSSFRLGLGIELAGSPLLAFLVVLLAAVGALCLAIFLSTFARTELQIVQFIPIVIVPQFLLSGILFPVDSLPDVLKPVAPFLPLSYAVDGLRQVFVRGADLGLPALQLDLLVLAAFALFFAFIASLTIRRDVV